MRNDSLVLWSKERVVFFSFVKLKITVVACMRVTRIHSFVHSEIQLHKACVNFTLDY